MMTPMEEMGLAFLTAVALIGLGAAKNAGAGQYANLDRPDAGRAAGAAPCFAALSDGWAILSLRNEGAKRAELEAHIGRSKPVELREARLRVLARVWDAPGDGWEFNAQLHRDCMADFHAGRDTTRWY